MKKVIILLFAIIFFVPSVVFGGHRGGHHGGGHHGNFSFRVSIGNGGYCNPFYSNYNLGWNFPPQQVIVVEKIIVVEEKKVQTPPPSAYEQAYWQERHRIESIKRIQLEDEERKRGQRDAQIDANNE
jgi:hypothetical protein